MGLPEDRNNRELNMEGAVNLVCIVLQKKSGGNRGGNNRRKHWNFSGLVLTGGQVAAGSNPVSPTIRKSLEIQIFRGFFFLTEIHNIPPISKAGRESVLF